ncbi:hypothetical protein QOZ80_9AG0680830 [Eleusine coracana subsp. coracana]|nr:hypothetical protein QOZ80_9AG0680830 [Eleusine coracana subsp. coracana]
MHVVVVCSLLGTLGLVIVILGVAGEAATAQAFVRYRTDIDINGVTLKCVYRTTPALGCGIVAALLALTSQVVVTATSLCCGCCKKWEIPTETRRIIGIVLSAVSWVMMIIVVAVFIAGAALNTDGEREANGDDKCYIAPGSQLFAAATVLSLITSGLQIASYIILQATPTAPAKSLATQEQQQELAVGQPVQLEQQQDAEQMITGADPPPSAPAISEAREDTKFEK